MEVQHAALDSSFWINAFRAQIVDFLPDYYVLHVPSAVIDEIEHSSTATGSLSAAGEAFREWREAGRLQQEEPGKPVDWFDPGENHAIALAIERGFQLLLDDRAPFHRSKAHIPLRG